MTGERAPSYTEMLALIEYWLHRIEYVFCEGKEGKKPEPLIGAKRDSDGYDIEELKRMLSMPRK